MPGFSAPKLLWLARHEPAALARTNRVLLTKDYVRLRLTGEAASDRANSSATLLMDTRARRLARRHPRGLRHRPREAAAPGRERGDRRHPARRARRALASAAGTPVVGGAGDNMCAGVGVGAVRSGDAYIGLGTSGVYFLANDRFVPARSGGMHTHRHAVPGLFCQNAVVLSAGAALAWVATLLRSDVATLVAEVEAARLSPADTPVFTPYLAGERTPHDDPTLTAAFSGLSHDTGPLHLVQAVLEGVALALADGHDALIAQRRADRGRHPDRRRRAQRAVGPADRRGDRPAAVDPGRGGGRSGTRRRTACAPGPGRAADRFARTTDLHRRRRAVAARTAPAKARAFPQTPRSFALSSAMAGTEQEDRRPRRRRRRRQARARTGGRAAGGRAHGRGQHRRRFRASRPLHLSRPRHGDVHPGRPRQSGDGLGPPRRDAGTCSTRSALSAARPGSAWATRISPPTSSARDACAPARRSRPSSRDFAQRFGVAPAIVPMSRRAGAHRRDDRRRRPRLPGLVRAPALRAGRARRALRRRRDGKAPSGIAVFRRAARRDLLPVQSLRQRGADPGRARRPCRPAARQGAAHRGDAHRRRPGDQGSGRQDAGRVGPRRVGAGCRANTTSGWSTASCSTPRTWPWRPKSSGWASGCKVADTMMNDDSDKQRRGRGRPRIRGRARRRWATLTWAMLTAVVPMKSMRPRQEPPLGACSTPRARRALARQMLGPCAGDPARGGHTSVRVVEWREAPAISTPT